MAQHEAIPGVREVSPTAANAANRLFPNSGEMDYLVVLAMQGGARMGKRINAATGDEAAAKASAQNPGWRVAYVGPVGDEVPMINEMGED